MVECVNDNVKRAFSLTQITFTPTNRLMLAIPSSGRWLPVTNTEPIKRSTFLDCDERNVMVEVGSHVETVVDLHLVYIQLLLNTLLIANQLREDVRKSPSSNG